MSDDYEKLVRDKIPEIIEKNDEKPVTRKLDDKEYKEELEEKLYEEIEEYIDSDNSVEELADVLEVLRTLSKEVHGVHWTAVEAKRRGKYLRKGGFEERIYLEDVKQP